MPGYAPHPLCRPVAAPTLSPPWLGCACPTRALTEIPLQRSLRRACSFASRYSVPAPSRAAGALGTSFPWILPGLAQGWYTGAAPAQQNTGQGRTGGFQWLGLRPVLYLSAPFRFAPLPCPCRPKGRQGERSRCSLRLFCLLPPGVGATFPSCTHRGALRSVSPLPRLDHRLWVKSFRAAARFICSCAGLWRRHRRKHTRGA